MADRSNPEYNSRLDSLDGTSRMYHDIYTKTLKHDFRDPDENEAVIKKIRKSAAGSSGDTTDLSAQANAMENLHNYLHNDTPIPIGGIHALPKYIEDRQK
jgi:hypothetical protein